MGSEREFYHWQISIILFFKEGQSAEWDLLWLLPEYNLENHDISWDSVEALRSFDFVLNCKILSKYMTNSVNIGLYKDLIQSGLP